MELLGLGRRRLGGFLLTLQVLPRISSLHRSLALAFPYLLALRLGASDRHACVQAAKLELVEDVGVWVEVERLQHVLNPDSRGRLTARHAWGVARALRAGEAWGPCPVAGHLAEAAVKWSSLVYGDEGRGQ